MGLLSSKVDENQYRLKVVDDDDDDVSMNISLKPANLVGSRQISSQILSLNENNESYQDSKSLNKSPSKLSTAGGTVKKLPSQRSQSILRQESIHESKLLKHPSNLSKKQLIKQNSKISERAPWLMKIGNLNKSTLNDFDYGRVIGQGYMGTVKLCKTKQGKYFAMKGINKDAITRHRERQHVLNERDILQTLDSPFCIKLLGTFQDHVNIYLALEYAPGGELFHRLGRKKAFPSAVSKFYATEVFCALFYLQEKGFVYRDLKPENVVLDEDGHCKLIDFGFARSVPSDGRMHTLCGTAAYLSPEQLDGKLTNGYTRIVDWWSFGVFIYELLTGKTPFSKNNRESHYEIFLRILQSRIWFPRSFDQDSKDLISRLCHPQQEKRLCDPIEIKQSKYFEIPWDKVEAKRMIPPFIPRLKEDGDNHYFNKFNEKDWPIGKDNQSHNNFDNVCSEYFDF